MTKFIAIVSAKGGVGKTTSTINLASALDWYRRDIIILDANFNNPDVALYLGINFKEKTLHGALKGNHHINEGIYRHASGLKIIPGSISYNDAMKVQKRNFVDTIYGLTNKSEAVIIDCAPGIGENARTIIKAVDYLIIVTTPDLYSVSNSLKIVQLAKEYNKKILGILVNKVKGDYYELALDNIESLIGKKIIGIIPNDENINNAHYNKKPLVKMHPETEASIGFKKLACELIGEKYVENLKKEEENSLLKKTLKKIGF
ncbi:MAG: P-loop NTPase [Nanoarchaeota archaeon]